MTPDQLATLLTNLRAAAEVVEAIDDHDLRRRHGWNLADWRYDLVPWGVRFRYVGRNGDGAEVVAVVAFGRQADANQPPGTFLPLS